MFFLLFLTISCLHISVFLCRGDTFVNHHVRESPTSLTAADFRRARNPPPDQPLDWEKQINPDLVEGDIAGLSWKNFRQTVRDATFSSRDSFVRSAVRQNYKRWTNGIVPVAVSSKYPQKAKAKIAAAITEFHSRTCVKFVQWTRAHSYYVYIRPTGDGCYSDVVGRRTTRGQTVSLDDGCFQNGTIIHELMHALGFFHEHNRNDRDNYVQIYRENIINGMEIQFRKRSSETIDHLGTQYDYTSVMHYPAYGFSKNGFPTIGVPRARFIEIGQRNGFSDVDVRRINLLYRCDEATPMVTAAPISPSFTAAPILPSFTAAPISPSFTPASTSFPRDCAELKEKQQDAQNGVYKIQPFGSQPISVYCDMDTLGGGWTVFQRRMNGEENFKRNWADYKRGFGTVSREHWLGNDAIHRLTRGSTQQLLVELREMHRDCVLHTQYNKFSVASEASNYKLRVSWRIASITKAQRESHVLNFTLRRHSGMEFSTIDRDNDRSDRRNCADVKNGGWWYDDCEHMNLNGLYSHDTCTQLGHIMWGYAHGWYYSFPWTEMKMRSTDFKLGNTDNNWCEDISCDIKCQNDFNCET